MKRVIKRGVGYLFITGGLVLLLAPLATHRTSTVRPDFVFLGVVESLDNESGSLAPPVLSADALEAYPALQATVTEMTALLDRDRLKWTYLLPRENIPTEEWASFQVRHAPGGAFVFKDRIFTGSIQPYSVRIEIEVPHLRMGCKWVGGILLAAGLLAWFGAFPTSNAGIPIGRRSAVVIWDVCTMSVGAVFTWWFVEFILSNIFQTATQWDEPFAVGMGVFWVVFVYPTMALITSAMASQRLLISRDCITLNGLFGASSVPWSELEGLAVSQAYSPRTVGGVGGPHRLMKILSIRGGSVTLCVMEPPYASTKKLIGEQLLAFAPERWKERIATVAGKEWLSLW